ncbi:hypothetical protein HMN09_00918400 [Mycena chlorophos]|uniref:BTB domain-containing protein n=1 Tax=Mycena chlorophos TaxID=658473 RepID=A0A8H6SJ25_MYCCL|nr:hypothetical protein HMN09_00918400 [Mycena chlorophos]
MALLPLNLCFAVNSPDADVLFQSSDGVLFRVHSKYLEACTEGFPPVEHLLGEPEIVHLTEPAAILELLFEYVYPRRHPTLDGATTPFALLAQVAEAAEKYQVFPAMTPCSMRMRDNARVHPTEVMTYAAKHGYPHILSKIAPHMLRLPLIDVVEKLPPHLVLPWVSGGR